MILMRVVATVRQDDVGINLPFQRLEPRFDLLTLFREKPVPKRHYLYFSDGRVGKKVCSGRPCFELALACAAKNTPMNIQANTPIQQAQKRRSRSDLNVIRMCA